MKTRILTLCGTILMMGAVYATAGQPARGSESGDHGKNSRRETKLSADPDRQRVMKENSTIYKSSTYDDRSEIAGTSGRRESAVSGREVFTDNKRTGHTGPKAISGTQSNQPVHAVKPEKKESSYGNPDYGKENQYVAKKSYKAANQYPGGNHPAVRENSRVGRKNAGQQGQGPGTSAAINRDRHDVDREEGYSRQNNWNEREHRNLSRKEWEHRHYAWNDRSWNYSHHYRQGTIPAYFRDNRNYWYYPGYGHILRGFGQDPYLFHSGHNRYYFDNGFFYRYYNGIGYVWVDDPFGIWFNELPFDAVRVRIAGKIYFRLGKAYFKAGSRGFRMVVLPERYYLSGPAVYFSVNF